MKYCGIMNFYFLDKMAKSERESSLVTFTFLETIHLALLNFTQFIEAVNTFHPFSRHDLSCYMLMFLIHLSHEPPFSVYQSLKYAKVTETHLWVFAMK